MIAKFLRFLAILQMLTGLIMFLPAASIDWWHRWLGLGHAPDDLVLRYVIRGGGYVQGAIGVLLWVIATDVVRHRPLVLTTGVIYLVSGPAFYFIDAVSGMPRYWCIFDGVSCLLVVGIILAMCWPPSRREHSSPAAPSGH